MATNDITTTTQYSELMKRLEVLVSLKEDVKHIREKQDEMSEDSKELGSLLKDPEKGIIVRLRRVEDWKDNWMNRQSKISWIILGSVITSLGAILFKYIF